LKNLSRNKSLIPVESTGHFFHDPGEFGWLRQQWVFHDRRDLLVSRFLLERTSDRSERSAKPSTKVAPACVFRELNHRHINTSLEGREVEAEARQSAAEMAAARNAAQATGSRRAVHHVAQATLEVQAVSSTRHHAAHLASLVTRHRMSLSHTLVESMRQGLSR
jgi:hypothetical protein